MYSRKIYNGDWRADKLYHFFSSFPSSPSTLVSANMGNAVPGCSKRARKKRSTKAISDLAYKNTWSSLLKTSQADGLQLNYFPTKSPVFQSSILRYGKSFDDDELFYYRRGLGKVEFDVPRRRVRSASPVRQRRIHHPHFTSPETRPASPPVKSPMLEKFMLEKFLTEATKCVSLHLHPTMLSKKDSLEVNASSASESMAVNISNGLSTTDSMDVNVTSTLISSGNSMEVNKSMSSSQINCSIEPHLSSSMDAEISDSSMAANATSSLPTSGTSMINNISSSSDNVERIVTRILQNEHLNQVSNSRKSSRHPLNPYGQEWTKRFIYTLPAPSYSSRIGSPLPPKLALSNLPEHSQKYSSSPELHDLTVWQTWRDFTSEKWLTQHRSRRAIAELAREKAREEDAYRQIRKEIRSMELQRSSSLPRISSARNYRKTCQAYMDAQQKALTSRRKTKQWVSCVTKSNEATDRDRSMKELQSAETTPQPNKSSPKKEAKRRAASAVLTTTFGDVPPCDKHTHSSNDKRKRDISKLQPASGDNIASVLRRAMARRKYEQWELTEAVQRQRENDRKQRIRALRLDPAWKKAAGAGAKVADQDISARKCYKEVVERERLMHYHMEMEEMLARVWQMPPLFERLPRNSESYVKEKDDGRCSPTKYRPDTCQLRKAYSPIRKTLLTLPCSVERLDKKKSKKTTSQSRSNSGKEPKPQAH